MLLKISEDFLEQDEAQFLVFNIVQILISKCDKQENAKIAVLILV